MIQAYNSTSQTVAANNDLTFNTESISIGCATKYNQTASSITLKNSGIYLLVFNGIAAATGTETSPITVQMFDGTDEIIPATASALSASATDFVNLSFSVLIEVPNSCCIVDNSKTITVQNTGVAASFTNVNLIAIKIK